MDYLLVMSLSGGTMTCIYLLLRCLLRRRFCARTYYLIARTAVLFYLVPLPFLKKGYREILRKICPESLEQASRITLEETNYVLQTDSAWYVNGHARIQITAILIWLLVASLLLLSQLIEYLRTVRLFARLQESGLTDRQREMFIRCQERYGVKRHVRLYQGETGVETMTFGFSRPAILCNRVLEDWKAEFLICHEMVHIKRWDTLWKVLMQFAVFLHWYNLFVWVLYLSFEQVCECSCDETAMQGRSGEEVNAYLLLLVEEAQKGKPVARAPLRWKAGFGNKAKKKLKERIENLMSGKRWNRLAAMMLVGTLAFANSITVFAYKDVHTVEVEEEVSQEEIEKTLDRDTAEFVPNEVIEEPVQELELLEQPEICYDSQFTDEAGNIYFVDGDDSVEPHCNHEYVSGTYSDHGKTSDGGCEVRQFKAQRCSKCGHVLRGELISTTTYVKCPH